MEKYPELFTPVVGQVYLNHNGRKYLCTGIISPERSTMERISDGWTLIAVRTRRFSDGSIEWDHGLNGYWAR